MGLGPAPSGPSFLRQCEELLANLADLYDTRSVYERQTPAMLLHGQERFWEAFMRRSRFVCTPANLVVFSYACCFGFLSHLILLQDWGE